MIDIKSTEELKIMTECGKILSQVVWELMSQVKPGVSELDIDRLAEKLILEKGGEPGFKKVQGYKHTICACTNDVVVHGIPREYRFKEGDMVCIDCGVYLKGYHTDMAETVIVESRTGTENKANKRFLDIGKKALDKGIRQAVLGNRIWHISKAIQEIVEKEGGYSIVRSLIGHGVGKNLHEEPDIPGFIDRSSSKSPQLLEGMTLAIEVIYNMGKADVVYAGTDDWTIVTDDGSLSAVFERTIAVTKNGPIILTE